jgi:hypothetical protein
LALYVVAVIPVSTCETVKLIDCGRIDGAMVGPVGRRDGAIAVRQNTRHRAAAARPFNSKQADLQG